MSEQADPHLASVKASLVMPQVARLLRPLIGLLIRAGVTFPALIDLLRELYVAVADNEFRLSDKAQTDSRVSLLTGVHRKEVSRLRAAKLPVSEVSSTLSRSSQIIARWTGAAPFINESGQPKPLPRLADGADTPNFETLVESVTRDVRPRAVLDEWLDQGIVEIRPPGLVVLREAAFLPKPGEEDQFYYFGRNLHDHMAAAVANVRGETPAFFERAVHYDGLNETTAAQLATKAGDAAMNILLDVNKAAQTIVKPEPDGDWRWSLGVYVFKEKVESSPLEKPRDHGIGGTGIMGMITGFGSIFVNGYEVDIKPSQKIESDIENTGAQKLKLGQIVHVIAQGSGKHISANQVVIEHELIGPISALDSAKHQATILGQTVDVSKIPANQKLDIGQWVGVSGLRNATGTIQASLIEAAPVGTFKIIGNATELAPVLDSSQGLAIDRAEITGRISIRGHLSTDGTFIESYQPWSYFPQQDKLSRVSLEGFFNTQVGAALDLTADDIRADASEDETGQIFRHLFDSVIKNVAPPDTSTSPVIVTATVKDNVLTVQTITPTSPNASKATPIPKITGAVEDGPVTLPQSSTVGWLFRLQIIRI
eukprot:gene15527-15674_t